VTYEALASGLPVLTSPNAGSVIQDGREGILVPIRDVQALAEQMTRLRADQELRLKMGHLARELAEQYTWEKSGQMMAENFLALAKDMNKTP
jgi:glycosyltransferase involved in cell wall biosynthesis